MTVCVAFAALGGCSSAPDTASEAEFTLPQPVVTGLDSEVVSLLDKRRADIQTVQTAAPREYGDALGRLALTYHAHRLWSAAAVCYAEAFRLTRDPDWAHLAGYLAGQRGDDAASAAWFATVVEHRPRSIAAWIRLAEARLSLNRAAAARSAFEQARVLEPDHARVLAGIGRVDLLEEKHEDARERFAAALRSDPAADAVQYLLAVALRATGRHAEAGKALSKRGDREPNLADAVVARLDAQFVGAQSLIEQAARLGKEGRFDEAAALLREVLAERPRDATAHFYLGFVLLSMDRPAAALEQFRNVTEIDPDHDQAYLRAGIVLAFSGRDEEALQQFQRAAEARASPEAFERWARAAQRLRRPGEALAAYDRALEMAPSEPRIWKGRALAQVADARWAAAAAGLERAMELFPDDSFFYFLLARVLAAAPDAAVRDGERSLAICAGLADLGQDAALAATVAMAMAETGRFDEARDWQHTAIEMLPPGDARAKRFERLLAGYAVGRPCRLPWDPDDSIFFPAPRTGG